MSAVAQHPRHLELIERRKLRVKVARAVDRLIAILDDLDGDPEAEPWLGAPDVSERCPQWPRAANDDREQDAGDEPEIEDEHADRADYEPSLGAPERHHDQRRWTAGAADDREMDEPPGSATITPAFVTP